uniref:SWIRM domain-containing protein n=1 Tax=Syphacia muris TaxID=451379 RepID=A0A158R569_9BILA
MDSERKSLDMAEMSKEESLKLIETFKSKDILQWEDDDISLNCAAETSALPPSELSALEKNAFRDVTESPSVTLLYLFIRNKILQMWHTTPVIELSVQDVEEQLPIPYNCECFVICDAALTSRIFEFLKRYGYINHGIFKLRSGITTSTVKSVIIIGGGIAGLAAARQLKYFGIESRVIEARGRIGGRIFTYKKPNANFVADLGGMFIMGLNRNPIVDVLKQVNLTLKDCKTSVIPVYDSEGRFLMMLSAVEFRREEYELQLQREELYLQQIEYLEQMKRDEETMLILKEALLKKQLKLEEMSKRYKLSSKNEASKMQLEVAIKCNKKEIADMVEKYDICEKRFVEYDSKLAEFRRNGITEVFMNRSDRKKLDFYLSCLELATGAPASLCSTKLSHIDCVNRPFGSCVFVSEGMSVIIDELAHGFDIQTNCRVRSVSYNSQGVKVKYEYQNNFKREFMEISADACICTLPLGLLKSSRESGSILFDPPLPDWKKQACSFLGFGNICKVILIFEEKFWNTPIFGRLNDGDRGYFNLFYGLCEDPVLIGMISGEAAYQIDKVENPDAIVNDAMKLLKEIFNDRCPNEPKDAVVSRWGIDNYARGSNAFYTPKCRGDEPEKIATPLKDDTGVQRLFFAGEHTNAKHLGTIHGAYLSGVYNAALIANQFLGCNFEKKD